MVKDHSDGERKKGNVLFNDALNTFYYGYMTSAICYGYIKGPFRW